MARGYAQSSSERTQGLLNVPGPEIRDKVNALINPPGTSVGGAFINAFKLANEMNADAKEGRQVSLTALSQAMNEVRKLKDVALQYPTTFIKTDNGLIQEGGVTTERSFLSDFDKNDESGQTYDRHILDDKNGARNTAAAKEALLLLNHAPELFRTMKRQDVFDWVDEYVKAQLTPKMAEKFKGIKWNSKSYPD